MSEYSSGELCWTGPELLRRYLVPISRLVSNGPVANEQVITALRELGQRRPVLISQDERTVVGRAHLLSAAEVLGWTHIAARLDAAERATEASPDQISLVDEVEANSSDASLLSSLTTPAEKDWRETDEGDIERVNAATADRTSQWVGLPEFVPVADSYKLVISCSTEEDRDALLDALGIDTIHKGTRGTLSVWWPDRKKKDLASLRFELKDGR
jgi:hypothetical protein